MSVENKTNKTFSPYDFSTSEKRLNFIKELDKTKNWFQPLPNLEWITHTEFVSHGFFMYSDWQMFTKALGGRDGIKDFPPDWDHGWGQVRYAKCFIIGGMCGYVMLPNTQYAPSKNKKAPFFGWKGKLHIAKYRFCVHDMAVQKLSRCLNRYTCRTCGYSEDLDSSD